MTPEEVPAALPMVALTTHFPIVAAMFGVIGFVVLLVILGIVWGTVGKGPKEKGHKPNMLDQQRDDSPVWARLGDVQELQLPKGKLSDPRRTPLCVLDGVQLYNLKNRSTIVIAPTGSGKTPRIVVPIVNNHVGPSIVASVKRDVLALTQQSRRQMGRCFIFDATDKDTVRWSPLAHIHTWADALDAARWIQESSKVEGGSGGVQDREFWDAQARFLLSPLLWLCARTPGQSMATIMRWLSADQRVQDEVASMLEDLNDEDAILEWRQFCAIEPKQMASVISTAKTVLEAWTHPRVRDAVSVRAGEPALDIEGLLDGRDTLYLVAPANAQAMFTAIYETLVNAILMAMERRAHARGGLPPEEPLLLMLDEAANISPLRTLDQVASKGAGEGVILVTVWQDEGQITRIYGPAKARTIVSNHTAKVYMAGISDPDTLRTLTELIGQDTFEMVSTTYGEKTTKTQSYTIADVAPKRWLRQMPPEQVIVIVGRFPPIKGSARAWFEDKRLRSQVDPTAAAEFDAYYADAEAPANPRPRLRMRTKLHASRQDREEELQEEMSA